MIVLSFETQQRCHRPSFFFFFFLKLNGGGVGEYTRDGWRRKMIKGVEIGIHHQPYYPLQDTASLSRRKGRYHTVDQVL